MIEFTKNACECYVNDMDFDVYVNMNGWDSMRECLHDIEVFAEGANDPMAEDIEDELEKYGLAIIYPGTLSGDNEINFKLEKIK